MLLLALESVFIQGNLTDLCFFYYPSLCKKIITRQQKVHICDKSSTTAQALNEGGFKKEGG